MTDTETRVVAILRDHLGTDAYIGLAATDIDDALALDTRLDVTFVEGLRMDSLDLIEVTMATEEEFGIEIADDELEAFGPQRSGEGKTIRDWVALVDGKRCSGLVSVGGVRAVHLLADDSPCPVCSGEQVSA